MNIQLTITISLKMQKQIHPANRRLLMKQQCANRRIFLRLDDVLINRIEVKIFLS